MLVEDVEPRRLQPTAAVLSEPHQMAPLASGTFCANVAEARMSAHSSRSLFVISPEGLVAETRRC